MLCSLHFVSQRWRHFTVSPAERRKPNKSSVGTKAQSAKSMGDPAQTEVRLSHVAHSPNHSSSPSKRIQASGHKAESTGKQIKENISLIVLLPKHNQDSLFWSCGDFLYSGHACNCISCLSYWVEHTSFYHCSLHLTACTVSGLIKVYLASVLKLGI